MESESASGLVDWPNRRVPLFREETPRVVLDCWQRSRDQFERLRAELDVAGVSGVVRTVFVCGSLGRMETVASSDCDVVVVLSESDRDSAAADSIVKEVLDAVGRTGFRRPRADGIFAQATSFDELLDASSKGQVDEDLGVFGKRIQALLDSQPIVGGEEFGALQNQILHWYASAPQVRPDAFSLGWLVDDLIRYWRSLCARTRWLHIDKPTQWRNLNVKLRHSRLVLYAALLLVLMDAALADDPIAVTARRLRLTPLERLIVLSRAQGDEMTERVVVEAYARFLTAMSGPSSASPHNEHDVHAAFIAMLANGDQLATALLRLTRRHESAIGESLAASLLL